MAKKNEIKIKHNSKNKNGTNKAEHDKTTTTTSKKRFQNKIINKPKGMKKDIKKTSKNTDSTGDNIKESTKKTTKKVNKELIARQNTQIQNIEEQENSLVVMENGSLLDENTTGNNLMIEENDENYKNRLPTSNGLVKSGNNTEQDIVGAYIRQISQFPLLTEEEEVKLFNQYIDEGNQKAGQAIVMSHLRLVVKIAMQYKKFGINMMDLIAEGNLGLMTALQKFDRSKKARFSTYASLWIKAKIQEFILKSWNAVKVGSQAVRKQLLFNFSGVKKMLGIGKNTDAIERDKKIANYFGLNNAEYNDVVNSINNREASLDAPMSAEKDNRASVIDTLDVNNNFVAAIETEQEERIKKQIFLESLSILNERQRDIIFERYLNENGKVRLEDLSAKYGVSKERIRQIEEGAIKKLKEFAENYQKKNK